MKQTIPLLNRLSRRKSYNDSPSKHRRQVSAICKSCGMCCDGTLFHKANVKDDGDRILAESLGLKTTVENEKQAFLQPCHHFNLHCTIYNQSRPSICGAYFCDPIRKARMQQISLQQVEDTISHTLMLLQKFNQARIHYPKLMEMSILQVRTQLSFGHLPEAEQVAMRRKYAPLLLIGLKLFPLVYEIIGKRRHKEKKQ